MTETVWVWRHNLNMQSQEERLCVCWVLFLIWPLNLNVIYLADQTTFILPYTVYTVLVHSLLFMLSVKNIIRLWRPGAMLVLCCTYRLDLLIVCFWKMSLIWAKLYLTILCRESILYIDVWCIWRWASIIFNLWL